MSKLYVWWHVRLAEATAHLCLKQWRVYVDLILLSTPLLSRVPVCTSARRMMCGQCRPIQKDREASVSFCSRWAYAQFGRRSGLRPSHLQADDRGKARIGARGWLAAYGYRCSCIESQCLFATYMYECVWSCYALYKWTSASQAQSASRPRSNNAQLHPMLNSVCWSCTFLSVPLVVFHLHAESGTFKVGTSRPIGSSRSSGHVVWRGS